MAFILTVDQEVPITVTFADDMGNATTVDGVPVWATSDPAVLEFQASDDGMSCVVQAVGPIGQGQISVTADARMGSDVVPVIGLLDIEIVPGEAVRAALSAGSPVQKTVVVPPSAVTPPDVTPPDVTPSDPNLTAPPGDLQVNPLTP
jgi:hypothetical protein